MRTKIVKVMNFFCANSQHSKCKGISKIEGCKSNPEKYVCTCNCHTITDLDSPRVFTSMAEKRRFDMQIGANYDSQKFSESYVNPINKENKE